MEKSRRLIGCLIVLLIVVLGLADFNPASAQNPAEKPIVWRMSTAFRPTGYVGQGVSWFCDKVKTFSNSRLIIEPYFVSSLGYKAPQILSVLKQGFIEISEMTLINASGLEPVAGFNELSFLFGGDYEKTWRFATTVFWPEWEKLAEEKWNCIPIGPFTLGGSNIFSKKPIRSLADFKGMKIRTGAAGATAKTMTALGAKPYLISTSELYTALQRGMIEACVTSEVSAVGTKLWEVLDYNVQTRMAFYFSCVMVNKHAFARLPKDLQSVLLAMDEVFKDHMLIERSKMMAKYGKILLDNGLTEITLTPEFAAQLKEGTKSVWEKYTSDAGPLAEELLKKAKKF